MKRKTDTDRFSELPKVTRSLVDFKQKLLSQNSNAPWLPVWSLHLSHQHLGTCEKSKFSPIPDLLNKKLCRWGQHSVL